MSLKNENRTEVPLDRVQWRTVWMCVCLVPQVSVADYNQGLANHTGFRIVVNLVITLLLRVDVGRTTRQNTRADGLA